MEGHPCVNICVGHVNAVWNWQLVPELNSYRYEILQVNIPLQSVKTKLEMQLS